MSRRIETQEVQVITCDLCGKDEAFSECRCMGCGKDICWNCRQKVAVKYDDGVFYMSSRDAIYCPACDASLKDDPLHMAYVAIKNLRAESDAWGEEFTKRKDAAQDHLCKVYDARKKKETP